jgi:hypothetical protein
LAASITPLTFEDQRSFFTQRRNGSAKSFSNAAVVAPLREYSWALTTKAVDGL